MKKKTFPTHIVAVFGVVENARGEVLLLQHRHKGTWMFPGGQVENGENLMQALYRETMEESGMEIEVGRLFCVASSVVSHPGYNGYETVPTKVILGFACTWLGGEFRANDEAAQARWVTKEQVYDMLPQPLRDYYQAYLDGGAVRYLAYAARPAYDCKMKREI